MSENQIVVPAIPEAVMDKTFGPSDIKWVKTVNDNGTSCAYLPPDIRVVKNSNGVFFCLQLNPRFMDSLNRVPIGDIILLYQKLKNEGTENKYKCFTHLATPIGDKVIKSPYTPPGWPGRWVKAIAMTENQIGNSIAFHSTPWQTAGFTGQCRDLSFYGRENLGNTQYSTIIQATA